MLRKIPITSPNAAPRNGNGGKTFVETMSPVLSFFSYHPVMLSTTSVGSYVQSVKQYHDTDLCIDTGNCDINTAPRPIQIFCQRRRSGFPRYLLAHLLLICLRAMTDPGFTYVENGVAGIDEHLVTDYPTSAHKSHSKVSHRPKQSSFTLSYE